MFIKLSYIKNLIVAILVNWHFFHFPSKTKARLNFVWHIIFITRWISCGGQSRYSDNFVESSLTRVSILPSHTPQLPDREFEGQIGTTCFGRRSRESTETKLAPSSISKFHEGSLNLSVIYMSPADYFTWCVLIPVLASDTLPERNKIEKHITIPINVVIKLENQL